MDTSKKYIEMCEKAEEIQANWQRRDGDFILVHPTDSLPHPELRYPPELWSDVFTYQKKERQNYDKVIWLPRQDQLQEIIIDDFDDVQDMFYTFDCWVYERPYKTAEQLWLAFVMKLEYNKHWNGKEWKN